MSRDDSDGETTEPRFELQSEGRGVRIWDPLEKVSFSFETPSSISLRKTATDDFPFPVDAAMEFQTKRVEIPFQVGFNGWDTDGTVVGSFRADDGRWSSSVDFLEIPSAPMRLFVAVGCDVTISGDGETTVVELESERPIAVGARSHHDSPAGTITVTDDVKDAMRAVSLFGSSLKMLSPERSFPSHRGHPPLVERGEEFSVPASIDRPDTGVRLVLPPKRRYLYASTSLVYYLGAKVVPGRVPRLETSEFQYPLEEEQAFEREVSDVLQHVFFLDCLTREEGFYPSSTYERKGVEPLVDLDFVELLDGTISEQIEAYLDVPFEAVKPSWPEWYLTADVAPTSRNVAALPFVADDLAIVRCPAPSATSSITPPPTGLVEFCRTGRPGTVGGTDACVVDPPPVDTAEHVWIGDGVPMGSNKATVDAYRHHVESGSSERSTICVRIVCNDSNMRAEGRVQELYNFRDTTRHDVEIAYDVTTDELRMLFASSIDFLHYIGHVDRDGIECVDGSLDTRTLDEVRVESFLLNACRSYHQSAALVEKGCRAGVATLSDVSNEPVTELGCFLARLLGAGFPLRTALSVAQRKTLSGEWYVIVGVGGTALCQAFSVMNPVLDVERNSEGAYAVTVRSCFGPQFGVGSISQPVGELSVDDRETYFLDPRSFGAFELSADELDGYLSQDSMPVEYDGDLYWSDEITAADLD